MGERRKFFIKNKIQYFRALDRKEAERKQRLIDKQYQPLTRQRHIRFVNALFPKVLYIMANPSKKKNQQRNDMIAAGLVSLEQAGYRKPITKADGSFNEGAINIVKDTLKRPQIMNALAQQFAAAGLTEQKAAEIMALIAANYENDAKTALDALKTYYKLTVPVVQQSQNVNVNVDGTKKFYNPVDWANDPGMAIDEGIE